MNLWHKRELIRQFMLLDLQGKYRSAYLGAFWSLIHPVLMLAVYTFLILVISRPAGDAAPGGRASFVFALFSGIIVFNFLGECLVRASLVIVSHRSYVKKIIFPIEVLPVSIVGSALIHFMISLGVLLIGMLVCGHMPSGRLLLLPLILLPLVLCALGLSWVIALLGVYVRDIAYVMPFVAQALFFLTPIVYPFEAVPAALQPFFRLNLMKLVVEETRNAILFGRPLDWQAWSVVSVAAGAVCVFGYSFFMRAKSVLADAL